MPLMVRPRRSWVRGDQGSPNHLCVCVCLWGGLDQQLEWAVASGALISRHQQLRRLESRGSYWTDWVSEPSCWRDPHCTYVYMFHGETLILLSQKGERDEALAVVCVSALCAHSTMNIFSLLLVAPEGMDLRQPHICQATGFAPHLPSSLFISYFVIWSSIFYILVTEQWVITDHTGDKAASENMMPNLPFGLWHRGTVLYITYMRIMWVKRVENMTHKLLSILFTSFYD